MEKRNRIVDLENELLTSGIELEAPIITEHDDGNRAYHILNYYLTDDYRIQVVGVQLDKGRKTITENDHYKTASIISPKIRTEGGLVLMAEGIAKKHDVGLNKEDKNFYVSKSNPEDVVRGLNPLRQAHESFERGKMNFMDYLESFWR